MSLLREYIRKLLTEAAKTPEDLLAHDDVHVFIRNEGDMMKIFLSYEDGKAHPNPNGSIWIRASKKNLPCGNAWEVASANAQHGWGPLLYDVAMEWATLNGGGLISDRFTVSQEARAVWDYYMNNRPDVTSHQLDDVHNSLTPEDDDNCDQDSAMLDAGSYHFERSILSKRYTAPPKTLRKLKSLERLIT